MSICFNEKMNVLGFWNEEKRFENINLLDRYFPYTPKFFWGGTLIINNYFLEQLQFYCLCRRQHQRR